MKLTTITWVSVDGVMQGLGGAEEDRRDGFERGGWAMPFFHGEAAAALGDIYARADAFLFGRWTYVVFAGSWGTMTDPSQDPIGLALNTRPKFVASNTLTDPQWADSTILSGDLADAVAELKAKPGGELQVHGSCSLIRWLHERDLIDEMIFFTAPIVLGQGMRLFPDTGPDRALEVIESRTTPDGVNIQVYRPGGKPRYGAETAPAWSGTSG